MNKYTEDDASQGCEIELTEDQAAHVAARAKAFGITPSAYLERLSRDDTDAHGLAGPLRSPKTPEGLQDVVTVADRLQHIRARLQDHLTRALDGGRVDVNYEVLTNGPNQQFEMKVRRGTTGYTYRLAIARASLFLDFDDALRAQADIFIARIYEREHMPSMWEHLSDEGDPSGNLAPSPPTRP